MKALINFLLLITAIIIASVLYPVGFVFKLIGASATGSWKKAVIYLSVSAISVAIAIDSMGNVVCSDFFNNTMRKPGGYPFGNYRETISLVLGKNKQMGTLSRFGQKLSNLLNWIEPNHVEKAAIWSQPK